MCQCRLLLRDDGHLQPRDERLGRERTLLGQEDRPARLERLDSHLGALRLLLRLCRGEANLPIEHSLRDDGARVRLGRVDRVVRRRRRRRRTRRRRRPARIGRRHRWVRILRQEGLRRRLERFATLKPEHRRLSVAVSCCMNRRRLVLPCALRQLIRGPGLALRRLRLGLRRLLWLPRRRRRSLLRLPLGCGRRSPAQHRLEDGGDLLVAHLLARALEIESLEV
mmetsp:Transcript_38617/g.121702  ORF Transcript_38617/g.121702 Transcript_38617/m.121702 type:complete len:224 (-) Transcript_38617:21-692(-)